MLYGIVTNTNILLSDKNQQLQPFQFSFDFEQYLINEPYQEAKIILSYSFQKNIISEKLSNLKITFYILEQILPKRNSILFPQQNIISNIFLEINLDQFKVQVFFKANDGVEIISNKEFERTFTPTNPLEDDYYKFLKQYYQFASFKQALNLDNIMTFSKDNNLEQLLYQNICRNFIADQVISNLAGSVYVISEHLNVDDQFFSNYIKDRPYFSNLFMNLAIVIKKEYISLFDMV